MTELCIKHIYKYIYENQELEHGIHYLSWRLSCIITILEVQKGTQAYLAQHPQII